MLRFWQGVVRRRCRGQYRCASVPRRYSLVIDIYKGEHMNGKLFVSVITGALATSPVVRADTSNVEIYGWLFPQFQHVKSAGATPSGTPVADLAPARSEEHTSELQSPVH